MKKYDISTLVKLLAAPAAITALGVFLLVNPDGASSLVGKVLAWALVLLGGCFAAGVLFGDPVRRMPRVLRALLCLAVGLWFLRDPLVVARNLGRILGILLLGLSLRDLKLHVKVNGRLVLRSGALVSILCAVTGLVLFLLPMTTSRLFFTVCGIVLVCVGILEGYSRLKRPKKLDGGDDPKIIDAL